MFSHTSFVFSKIHLQSQLQFQRVLSNNGGSKGKTQVGARLFSKDRCFGPTVRFLRYKGPKDVWGAFKQPSNKTKTKEKKTSFLLTFIGEWYVTVQCRLELLVAWGILPPLSSPELSCLVISKLAQLQLSLAISVLLLHLCPVCALKGMFPGPAPFWWMVWNTLQPPEESYASTIALSSLP